MVLSVIIVSYNVKYFLEQCLCSVQRAIWPGVEVFVIDNHSSDGSVEYLREKFPFVQFISNDENVGFAKANNQVLEKAKGEYVLFLNPDTIIPEDLFTQCIAFLQSHADAGAMGVRMIDGSGRFLKESKRGFPSPWVAFCKMSGLTTIFPRSKTFAEYYLGHLSEEKITVADALAGACMFVRKDVLNKTGGFDEQFFMYAEDIDLSYRVQQAGYKNYYFPGCTIIHFKGESTRKDKKYVRLFYKAMSQFVHKHFRGKMANLYVNLLPSAIWIKSLFSSLRVPHQEKTNTEARNIEFVIVGEKQVINKTASAVKGEKKITFLEDISDSARLQSALLQRPSRAVIFCESAGLSFKKIIETIDLTEPGSACYISADGSHSIVGSSSKSSQGHVILL
jgi:N-acetylglucosaminyl-diphospho-decaprenol L-rhamnosyltransferase